MKTIKLLLIACLSISVTAISAQKVYKKADVFSTDKIIWFGMDYSLAKLKGEYAHVGDPLYKTPAQIVEDFFEAWNTVIVSEPGKYNIKKTFDKKTVENDVMVVEKRNSKVDPMELVTHKEYVLDKEAVKIAVKDYKSFTNKEGIGVVFFTECLNNDENIATYYVTFFDIATSEVLICEKVNGKPSGAGLKSYWANSILGSLGDARKLYDTWK